MLGLKGQSVFDYKKSFLKSSYSFSLARADFVKVIIKDSFGEYTFIQGSGQLINTTYK